MTVKRPTVVGVQRFSRARFQDVDRGRRVLQQWFWPGAPNAKLLVIAAVALIGLLVGLTYLARWGYWSSGDSACKGRELRCGLGIHIFGTFLAGIIAYYLIFLRREARAARRWRRQARKRPESLFKTLPPLDGLTGEARSNTSLVRRPRETDGRVTQWIRQLRRENALIESIISRDDLVDDLVEDLDEAKEPRILVAPSGSGKTMVLLKLAEKLSRHGQVPVVVSLRGQEKLDFAELAHEVYRRYATAHTKEEADKQWRWMRKRDRITILADELEKSDVSPAERVRALESAARERLRIVVTCRSDGIPANYPRGRITLAPLETKKVIEDLLDRLAHGPANAARLQRSEIESLVKEAEIEGTPYYLAIARVLIAVGGLRIPAASQDARMFLMSAYRQAITDGRVRPDAGLSEATRRRTFTHLQAIAYARLLGAATEPEIEVKIKELDPGSTVNVEDSVDYATRLGVLVNRYDGEIHFGHPTTVAYFASCFLVDHRHDRTVWEAVLNEKHLTTLRALALTFANASTKDHELNERTVRNLLKRVNGAANVNGRRPVSHVAALSRDRDGQEDDGDEGTNNGFIQHFERLWLIATAAEIASFDRTRSDEVTSELLDLADMATGQGEEVAVARRRVVMSIRKLNTDRAYLRLWSVAGEHRDYVLRRQAAKALIESGAPALDALAPRISATIEETKDRFADRSPEGKYERKLLRAAKSAAWILPTLHTTAERAESSQLDSLRKTRNDLYEAARTLQPQFGLEPSMAQGLKSDAMRGGDEARPIDRIAIQMVVNPKLRARFWFSRMLALQAVTRRAIDTDESQRALALDVIEEARRDEHPFVAQTANLCHRAVKNSDWDRYQWDDITDIAAGSPHNLVNEATQLIGDVVLALNLYEYGNTESKLKFAQSNDLPACLSISDDRLEILGSVQPPSKCVFADRHPCFCPYLYEPPKKEAVRRELSRAFCRHARLTARRAAWQPKIPIRALKAFWSDMENLARF